MVKLVWTELSTEDLKEIFNYIAKDSVRYASITVHRIYNRAQDIAKNPYIGRIVPEINIKAIREVISGNYRIRFKFLDFDYVHGIFLVAIGNRKTYRKKNDFDPDPDFD